MKENKKTMVVGTAKRLTLVVAAAVLIANIASAAVTYTNVYNNAQTRQTNGLGESLYFAQDGYEYGDEVVLGVTNSYQYLTEFKLEYYAANLPVNATMRLRLYANDGVQYGTNLDGSPYYAPSTVLWDSLAFTIVNPGAGFGSYTFNKTNSDFSVIVPKRFTWTVEFGNVGAGTAGLALYGPNPAVGANYDQYWEASGVANSWVSRDPVGGYADNFGAQAKALVDTKPPVIKLTGPVDGTRTATNYLVVTGTANDPDGPIAMVLYKLNNGSYLPATLTSTGINSNWTAILGADLKVWKNTFTAKVIDGAGKEVSFKTPLTYTYVVTNTLVVNLSEGGTSAAITPYAHNSTNYLEVGQIYKVTVVPTVGVDGINTFWHSNSVLISDSSTHSYPLDPKKGGSFTFTMETNMNLTIYSVTNRFIAAAGQYYGLFKVSDADPDLKSAGYLTVKVDGKRGFSGKVWAAGEGIGYAGTFGLDGTGYGKKLLTSKKQIGSLTNRIYLSIDWATNSVDNKATVSGQIINLVNSTVSDLSADRVVWTLDSPATNYSKRYTMILPPGGASGSPSGYSRGYFTIDDFGKIKLVGLAADGQKIVAKTAVISKDGYWPFFAQNSPDPLDNKLNKGALWGWLQFLPKTDTNGINRLETTGGKSQVAYVKTPVTTTYFASGFTNISTARVNSYSNTNKPSPVVGLNGLTGLLKLTGGGLSTTTNIPVYEYHHDGVVKAAAAMQTYYAHTNISSVPQKLAGVPWGAKTVAVNASGMVNGSFYDPDAPTTLIKFFGISMPEEQKAYGFFLKGTALAPGAGGSFVIEGN